MSDNILRYNGFELDFSEGQMVSLTQLWKMMGSPASQTPNKWKILPESKRLIACVSEALENERLPFKPIVTKRGSNNPETLALKPIAKMYEIYLAKSASKIYADQGYIYLFEGSNILKLGFTRNVGQRLKSLCRWQGELELVTSKKGDISHEQSYHRHLHMTGEYLGDEWYPSYRKQEILQLMSIDSSVIY